MGLLMKTVLSTAASIAALVFFACSPATAAPIPDEVTRNFTPDDVQQAISYFAPLMYLHPLEPYKMDDPSAFLNSRKVFLRGAIIENPDDYSAWVNGTFYKSSQRSSFEGDSPNCNKDSILFPTIYNDPSFKCFLQWDDRELDKGNQSRVVPLISVRQQGSALYLTFWFFYPFNGPGHTFIFGSSIPDDQSQRGRHYGDWEHVTIRVLRTEEAPLHLKLDAIYLSRHSATPWYSDLSKFTYGGKTLNGTSTQPIVYVALNTHANYPSDHEFNFPGKVILRYTYKKGVFATINLYDEIRLGSEYFDASTVNGRVILVSNVPGLPDAPPGWYPFNKRWGDYIGNRTELPIPYFGVGVPDTEVESAPEGPVEKEADDITHFLDRPGSISLTSQRVKDAPLHVFALAYDKAGRCCNVMHNVEDGGHWDDWTFRKGGVQAIASTIVRYDTLDTPRSVFDSKTHVFALGNDGKLYDAQIYNNKWTSDWSTKLSVVEGMKLIAADYAFGMNRSENLELFSIRASDGALLHNQMVGSTGSWSGWYPDFKGAPRGITSIKTTRDAAGSFYVFALTADGTIIWSDLEMPWKPVPGTGPNGSDTSNKVRSFAVAGGTEVELMAIKEDRRVHRNAYMFDKLQWLPSWDANFDAAVGQNIAAESITLIQDSSPNVEAFLVDDKGKIIHNWKDRMNWHQWANQASGFPDEPSPLGNVSSLLDNMGQVRIFTVTKRNDIDDITLTDKGWAQQWNRMFFDGSDQIKPN